MKITASDTVWSAAHSAARSTHSRVQVSAAGTAPTADAAAVPVAAVAAPEATANDRDALEDDPRLQLIQDLLERMTGQRLPRLHLRREEPPAQRVAAVNAAPVGNTTRVRLSRTVTESESTSLHATAQVHTADGQVIRLDLQLEMSRSYSETTQLDVQRGAATGQRRKDPLVVNFAAPAAQLESGRFAFDVDADGQNEAVATLGAGSGYLTLDRNGNGRVDDGSELFGTASGNGFADLARWDEDGNGWIDAGDAVFQRLGVWVPGADGQGSTVTLASTGIGALSLNAVASPFELRDSRNQALGAVRATALYLREDGSTGSVQQVDWVV